MGKYIAEALDWVGKQSYANWEVIAVDDCGPDDGTKEIIDSFVSEHPEHRVEFIRHEKNGGVSKARNTAIHAAKGEFLAFLDPDDFWGSEYLMSQVETLESNDGVSLSYTDARFVDQESRLTGESWGPSEKESSGLPVSLYWRNFIAPCGVLAKRADVVSCGGFDEAPEMQHVEDWDLWLRMLEQGNEFTYNPLAESFYRKHSEAATADLSAMRQREAALRKKHSDLPPLYTRQMFAAMERRIEQLEGKQMAYEGSMFFRLGRFISNLRARPKNRR